MHFVIIYIFIQYVNKQFVTKYINKTQVIKTIINYYND